MGSILSAVYLSPGAMARLCLLALLVLSTIFNNSSANTLRAERDACEEIRDEVQNCQTGAYQEYKTAITAGEDGRPDWMARKSCNYITATIEECTNQLVGDCATEEEVNDMKDGQLEGLLEQLSDTIEEWDSEKCPAIKAYMDRNPVEDEEETQEKVAASVDTAAQEKEEEEAEETDNGEPAGSSEDPEKDGGDEEDSEDPEKDGGNEEDPEDQVDAGSGDVNNDSADAEDTNGEEQSNEEGGEDKETGDESNEGPESGSETAVASLSLVLVMYKICSA